MYEHIVPIVAYSYSTVVLKIEYNSGCYSSLLGNIILMLTRCCYCTLNYIIIIDKLRELATLNYIILHLAM